MHIHYLADHPHLIPQLAKFHFAEWSCLHPGETLEQRTSRLAASCGRNTIPAVLVAIAENGEPLGSAMLLASDLDERPDLTPWLAGVYVVADLRGRGLGTALVSRVEREAVAIGVERLYLYTPSAADFYARLGWQLAERCDHLGTTITIMSKELAPASRG